MTWQNGKVIGSDVEPQIYHDFPVVPQKRGDPKFVMSRSELTEFAHCPARWLAGVEHTESDATEWGTLIDCMALQPETLDKRYAITPATYPADGKKKDDMPVDKPWTRQANYCKEWEAERVAGGLACIKRDDYHEARKATDILLADKAIASLLEGSKRSVMVTGDWLDKTTGLVIPFKTLIDIVPSTVGRFKNDLADLKTCRSAHPGTWPREVFQHGYHVQAAAYLDLYESATREGRVGWMFALSENIPPYQVGRRYLSSEFIKLGRTQYRQSLADYAQCLKTGIWPDYEGIPSAKFSRDGWSATEPETWMMSK